MADAETAIDALRSDPDLAPLIEEHGVLELAPAEDTFHRLVVAIVRQQVSMASAAAIRERLEAAFEITPESIAAAEREALLDVGLSAAKAEYVQNVADAYIENGYGSEYFADTDDAAVLDELTAIRGVGEWTGKMYLMFCLGRPDVFPVEDLGVRKGMLALYGDDLTRGEMRSIAEDWRPYRSYASLYLWRAYD